MIALLAGLAFQPAMIAQELSAAELQRAAPFYRYWGLVDAPDGGRLDAATREAQQEFAGRGPALARHFLHHVQASPSNTAFFFLFRAAGDVETAQMLMHALMDPPMLQGLVVGRDPGELGIAIEAVLGNEAVRTNPSVVAALDDTIRRARAQPGGGRVAQTAVGLLGKCGTPEAARLLEALASDPDRAIRAAAVEALGHSGSASVGQTLARSLASDSDAEARARAASAMAQSRPADAAASLQAALERETNPQVVDATVAALVRLKALPQNPSACLQAAGRCWDAFVAKPLFDCWSATATRDDLIQQATSGSWMMRALALHSLKDGSFEQATRVRLLQSSVEILSRNFSGLPAPNSVSDSIARLTRDAFWDISGRQMPVAIAFADQITPISGHYMSAGRFGESYDLASKDRRGYAAWRRPQQLLSAGLAALLICPLLMARRLQRAAVGLLASGPRFKPTSGNFHHRRSAILRFPVWPSCLPDSLVGQWPVCVSERG